MGLAIAPFYRRGIMKLLFIKDAVYNGQTIFTPGVHEIESEDFAMRWVRRGIATIVEVEVAEDNPIVTIDIEGKIEVESVPEVAEDKPIVVAPKKKRFGKKDN